MDLRERLGLTYLFISHDLGVVRHLARPRRRHVPRPRRRERAERTSCSQRPNHPYTQALLAEVPRLDRERAHYAADPGEIPSPLAPPSRLPLPPALPARHASAARVEQPALREIAPGRWSACHLNDGGVGVR